MSLQAVCLLILRQGGAVIPARKCAAEVSDRRPLGSREHALSSLCFLFSYHVFKPCAGKKTTNPVVLRQPFFLFFSYVKLHTALFTCIEAFFSFRISFAFLVSVARKRRYEFSLICLSPPSPLSLSLFIQLRNLRIVAAKEHSWTMSRSWTGALVK